MRLDNNLRASVSVTLARAVLRVDALGFNFRESD